MSTSDPILDLVREWAKDPYGADPANPKHEGRGSFPDWLAFVRLLLSRLDEAEERYAEAHESRFQEGLKAGMDAMSNKFERQIEDLKLQVEVWKTKESECRALLEAAKMDALETEWKEIRRWKPLLHWCPDWDFLLIDKDDAEFESCGCFKGRAGKSEAS